MSATETITAVPQVPVTVDRPVPIGLDEKLRNPGLPRANKAVTADAPLGSEGTKENYTVMQQHVDFFDRDQDGIIYPWDTYVGFRRIGFNRLISFLAVPFIHGSFSYPSLPTWWPQLSFPIYIKNMHRCKHGSDSEVYDTEGRFVPEKFEELFTKYDRENKGGLSWTDIGKMVRGNMNIMDPVGWIAERLEWYVFWSIAANQQGILTKEIVRAQYDGTLWDKLAAIQEDKERRRRADRAKQGKLH